MRPKVYSALITLTALLFIFITAMPLYPEDQIASYPEAPGKTIAATDSKVSMDFEDAALKDILKAFSRQTGINFIASDMIEGKKITVFLNNVSIEDALSSILEANGFSYEKQAGDVYLIKLTGKESIKTVTRVFRLNYLQVYRMSSEEGATTTSSNVTIIGSPSYSQASAPNAMPSPAGGSAQAGQQEGAAGGKTAEPKNIIETTQSLMTKHGKIVADRRTNSLIVTDIPSALECIEKTLKELDVEPPQIMIQAEIIETTSSALSRIGLEYGGGTGDADHFSKITYGKGTSTGSQNPVFPTPAPFSQDLIKNWYNTALSQGALFKYGTITADDFNVVVKLIAQDDDTKFLSKPKIMTINNEPAVIKVTANTAIGIESVSVSQTTQNISTAERAETGIYLKVTPQVNSKGDIFMYIEPSVSRATASTFFTTQFMDPNYRSAISTVMVRDGDTVFIGGFVQTDNFKTTRKVPFLGDIPILGEPFKSHYKKTQDTEIIIFITPHIVKRKNGEFITTKENSELYSFMQKAEEKNTPKDKQKKQEKKETVKEAAAKETEKAQPPQKDQKRENKIGQLMERYSKKPAKQEKGKDSKQEDMKNGQSR